MKSHKIMGYKSMRGEVAALRLLNMSKAWPLVIEHLDWKHLAILRFR